MTAACLFLLRFVPMFTIFFEPPVLEHLLCDKCGPLRAPRQPFERHLVLTFSGREVQIFQRLRCVLRTGKYSVHVSNLHVSTHRMCAMAQSECCGRGAAMEKDAYITTVEDEKCSQRNLKARK